MTAIVNRDHMIALAKRQLDLSITAAQKRYWRKSLAFWLDAKSNWATIPR